MIKLGPAGRNSHTDWRVLFNPPPVNDSQQFDLKGRHEISQIFLTEGGLGVTSIQFQYVEDSKYVLSDEYGVHSNKDQFHTIELNHPTEYISGINGQYHSSCDSCNITQLRFTTNIKEYGPFGQANQGTLNTCSDNSLRSFSFRLGESHQFGGFHGTYQPSGLLSIGVYFSPKTVLPPNSPSKIQKEE